MIFRYDFFISYSSSDRQWAEKLRGDLIQRGVPANRIFLDTRSVELGTTWTEELRSAVRDSRHLLVLWTNAAAASQWVSAEQATFDSATTAAKDRRMILLRLQGESKVWSTLQMVDLTGQGLLEVTPQGMNAEQRKAWSQAVGSIKQVFESVDDRIPIGAAIVAMNRAEANLLDGSETMEERAEPLSQVLQCLGIADLDQLRDRYHTERSRWHPFGGNRPIEELLDEALGQLNAELAPGQPRFRWSFGNFLDADLREGKQRLSALQTDIALVVIDPLSLYCPRVFSRFSLLDPFFRRDQTLILVLAPFDIPAPYVHLRELVKQAATPLLDFHFEPSIAGPPEPRAWCGADICDTQEVTRLVKSQFVRRRGDLAERPGSTFTRIGRAPS